MGAGKTTLGKQLARELTLDFIDTDHEIEKRSGADINWIFDLEGESGFRKRETQIIKELSKKRDIVMAIGGGGVENIQNRQIIAARGTVIYLYATIEQQIARTSQDKKRPLIEEDDPKKYSKIYLKKDISSTKK
jgi:shikimate kinase